MPAKTAKATSANGKMFTYLSPTGELRLRLAADEREAVPPDLFARTAALKPYLAMSRAYAERLGARKGGERAASRVTKQCAD